MRPKISILAASLGAAKPPRWRSSMNSHVRFESEADIFHRVYELRAGERK